MASSLALRQAGLADATWTPELVIVELEDAMRTLAALPCRGHSTRLAQMQIAVLPAVGGVVSEPSSLMKPPIPSAATITRMDATLRWLGIITDDRATLRKVVALRTQTHHVSGKPMAWTRVAREVVCDPTAAKTWHAQGIAIITRRLNAAGVPLPRRPSR